MQKIFTVANIYSIFNLILKLFKVFYINFHHLTFKITLGSRSYYYTILYMRKQVQFMQVAQKHSTLTITITRLRTQLSFDFQVSFLTKKTAFSLQVLYKGICEH